MVWRIVRSGCTICDVERIRMQIANYHIRFVCASFSLKIFVLVSPI